MILNETVAAIADAIREKTGKSEKIKPIDFATEIRGISAGGGADLEGEYFLAKPNGRYWKLNFITEETITNSLLYNSLNEEQQYAIHFLYLSALGELSSVYTCVGQKVHEVGMVPRRGIYYTTYGKIQSNLGYSVGRMMYDSSRYDLLSCFAWQEAYPKLPSYLVDIFPEGVEITGLFDYVKFVMEFEQGQILSDEEVYTLLSEMFMVEPITKEEYENFVSNAENEDY